MIDRDIMHVLNKVYENIEGSRRGIPYSKEKVKRYAVLQFWKAKLKQLKEKYISQNKIDLRLKCIEVDATQVSIKQVQQQIVKMKKK